MNEIFCSQIILYKSKAHLKSWFLWCKGRLELGTVSFLRLSTVACVAETRSHVSQETAIDSNSRRIIPRLKMTIKQNFSNTRDPFRRLVCHLKMSAAETLSKNEYLAKNQSFKEKFENLKTISQPGTLSADIPASQKGFYSSYNPPINFRIAR